MPRLRVVASFYECPDEVAIGLDTVKAQTFADYECVIVDDCSGDETPALIRDWLARNGDDRFRFAPNETNRGIAWVRSHHTRSAGTEFVCFQEAGDTSAPERYAKSVAKMESDPGYGMVGCGFRNVVRQTGQSYVRVGLSEKDLTFDKLVHGNRFGGGELFYRTRALEAVGGIIDELPHCEDYYTSMRMARRFRIGYLNEVLYARSVDFKGLSFRPDAFVTQCLCVLAARDLATDQPTDDGRYLADRGGLDSYRHDPRLRGLLVRGALRSAFIRDWRGGFAIAKAALAA